VKEATGKPRLSARTLVPGNLSSGINQEHLILSLPLLFDNSFLSHMIFNFEYTNVHNK
jgi:hypothetical protein